MPRPLAAFTQGIVEAGHGVYGTTLFEGDDVDIPLSSVSGPAIISVLESGAGPRDDLNHTGERVGHPSFQVTVRHARFPNAAAKIDALYAWANKTNQTMGGRFWLTIRPIQRPFGRGKDASGRTMLTFNVETSVRD